jgi:isocitrate dehydrogenase
MSRRVKVPAGEKIAISHGKLQVPDHPIVPFIEGDGTGPDIWHASVRVLDAAVEQAYGGKRRIAWPRCTRVRKRRPSTAPTARRTSFRRRPST